jgi:fatty-acyl-CoA synthase
MIRRCGGSAEETMLGGEAEGVTYSLGVPTVWLGFEAYLSGAGARCSTLRRILPGSAAVPPAMIEAFARHGIDVRQGCG